MSNHRSLPRIALVGIVGLLAAGALAWFSVGGAVGLVASRLPPFPDWPPPPSSLAPDAEGEIHFETRSPYDFDLMLRGVDLPVPTIGLGTLRLPPGASERAPVPAVVLLHGSGGITPGREREVAAVLLGEGYATFVVDYYTPRGVTDASDYMAKVLAVTEFDAAADAYYALRLLSTHPRIDGRRIGLMGFSYGGMAVRIAMDERVREAIAPEHPGFAAFVDTYGPCFQRWGTTRVNGSPLLTLRGTEDGSNDLVACAEREAELRALGVEVDARVYQGAGHAWEADTPRRLFESSPYVAGCTVEYDAQGFSSVGSRSVVRGEPDDSRAERVVLRIASGGAMTDCVHAGYVVGRDDETEAKAREAYQGFLRGALAETEPGRS